MEIERSNTDWALPGNGPSRAFSGSDAGAAANHENYRRRLLPFTPHYQASLLALVWFLTALGMALGVLGGGAFFIFFYEPTRLADPGDWSGWFGPVVLGGVVALGLLAWLSLLMTHRIAGPIYRVLIGLDSIAHGDFSARTQLRRTDAFQELAEQLNITVESLRREREMARKRATALKAELENLTLILDRSLGNDSDARSAMDRARALCSELTAV